MFPFKEKQVSKDVFIREFDPEVDSDELVWHRDREDRLVEVIQSEDWWFQYDNEIPKPLTETLFIKAKTWHRVIKGPNCNKPLIVKIHKKR